MRAPWSFLRRVKPVLVSLSITLGDPLGADVVVITGKNFAPGDVPQWDGVPSPSFVRDSPTQFTAVTPAHAAGNVDVTVASPNGPSNPLAFEYWDLSAENPTMFLDTLTAAGAAAYAEDATFGVWTARARRIATTVFRRGIASAPADGGGFPVFARASNDRLDPATTTMNLADCWGTGDCFSAALFDASNVDAEGSQGGSGIECNDSVWGNEAGYGSMLAGISGGVAKAFFHYHSGANKTAGVTLAAPLTRCVVAIRKTDVAPLDAEMQITQDGALWITGDTHVGALTPGAVGMVSIGYTGYLPYYWDRAIKFIVWDDKSWSDAMVSKLYRWAALRHP